MIRLAATMSLLATVACADNYSVVIVRNIAPGDSCTVSPSTDISKSSGFLDVTPELPNGFLNPGYVMTPEISNPTGVPAVTPTRPGNPNAHMFYLKGVDVQVLAGPSAGSEAVITALNAAGLASRTVRLGGSIPPNGTIGLAFEAIDATMVQAMQGAVTTDAQVVVRVVAFGDMDGSEIETPPFEYPITLCAGCLLLDLGSCDSIPQGLEIPVGGECAPLQDANLACCDSGGFSFCPAVVPTM